MNSEKECQYISQAADGFLQSSGWLESVRAQGAVDLNGPVPWFTYSATRFLSTIVRPGYRVLEFGAGNSTRWWAQRVAEVVSVEHDPKWAAAVRSLDLANVKLIERSMDDRTPYEHSLVFIREFFPLGLSARDCLDPTRNYRAGLIDYAYQAYASVLMDYPAGYFNIIVVDGMARILTAWLAVRQLANDGMIIFDNSERNEYDDAYDYLKRCGYTRIDFSGYGPLNPYEWCTSIFVKTLNPLRPV